MNIDEKMIKTVMDVNDTDMQEYMNIYNSAIALQQENTRKQYT